MAKRRTKKQKIKAKNRKAEVMIQRKGEKEKKVVTESQVEKPTEKTSEKKLIIKDLVKTGLISLALLAILIGAYFFLK